MDDPAPKVSVVMTVFNGQRFLRPAVDSVLGQTMGDLELIVIDDGSTDTTPAILAGYAGRDARVRIITQANAGVSKAGNAGLRASRAPLIARMDADDVCRPDRLARQVVYMDANPQVVLLGGAYELTDEHDRLIHTLHPPLDNATLQQQCLTGKTPICHPLCMFRTADALAVGAYDETLKCALDLDLYLRLGERGEMACLPDVLLQYRQHGASISETKQTLQAEIMQRSCRAAWARRGLTEMRYQGTLWRATGGGDTLYRQHLKYGWWAYHAGQNKTARAYAGRALKQKPLSGEAWKLLYCGAVSRSPRVARSQEDVSTNLHE